MLAGTRSPAPRRWPGFGCWILAALLAAALVFGLLPVRTLRLSSDGRRPLVIRLPAGSELCYEYLHSVAKVPVREYFLLPALGGFRLVRTEHSDFGAGLPTESFGNFKTEAGVYVNSGLDRSIDVIPLRISLGSEQRLRLNPGTEIILLDYFNAADLVILEARMQTRIGFLILAGRGP